MAKEIKKISILPFLVCGVAALLIEVFATEFTEMERISENQGIRKGQVTREILALKKGMVWGEFARRSPKIPFDMFRQVR